MTPDERADASELRARDVRIGTLAAVATVGTQRRDLVRRPARAGGRVLVFVLPRVPLKSTAPGETVIQIAQPTPTAPTTKSRVIDVSGAGVIIDGITIAQGYVPTGNGGGINVPRNAGLTLRNSTVTGNTAREGGGINVDSGGTLTIENSTVNANMAERKGGGVRDSGKTTIVNSTFTDNTASQGGAVSTAGTTYITHATIVGNKATSSSSAGIDRNGGIMRVSYSIIGANFRTNGSPASDCSGTPDLLDKNLVSNKSGCNPVGAVLEFPPNVGPLDDNGGFTKTMALLDTSEALNAVELVDGLCPAPTNNPVPPRAGLLMSDQRGVERPFPGDGCDLGAYERGALNIDLALSVDTKSNYPTLADKTVEVGVVSVPTARVAAELATRVPADPDDGTIDASGLRSIGLRSIGLRSITLEDIGLRSIDAASTDLKASGLRSIGLRSIGLRSIGLRSIALRSIGLRSIPLSEIPLLKDGGWDALLATSESCTDAEPVSGTTCLSGLPLQSITLEDVTEADPSLLLDGNGKEITLESIDLSSTGLRSIALRSILLSGAGVGSLPLPDAVEGEAEASTWCVLLFDAATCADPTFEDAVNGSNLWEAQLAGGDVDQERILRVELSDLAGTVASTGLRSIGLRSIGLRSIYLENTGLRSIGLRSIALRSIQIEGTTIDIRSILNCPSPGGGLNDPCRTDPSNTLTLGEVYAGCLPTTSTGGVVQYPSTCLLNPNATMGQLLDLLSATKDINGETVPSLLDGLWLYDILFAFVPPEDVPWEVIDLEGASLQNVADPAQPTFDYIADVNVVDGPAKVAVTITLPDGFEVASAPNFVAATWCSKDDQVCTKQTDVQRRNSAVTNASWVEPDRPFSYDDLPTRTYRVDAVASGSYELRIPVRAGLTVGTSGPAFAVATATGPDGTGPTSEPTDEVTVEVVEAASGGPGRAPLLSDGELQLGHIGSSNDLDVFQFKAPAGTSGASARILLSNIPENVDYDLSVYGVRPRSLRGAPTDSQSSLGDVGFDLNPDDDVLATDVVNDIAIDINDIASGIDALEPIVDDDGAGTDDPDGDVYALRDISSRRSNNDEEVTIPALVGEQTYLVVVSGYYGDLSDEPYGLRVRLDRRTALPAVCDRPRIPRQRSCQRSMLQNSPTWGSPS